MRDGQSDSMRATSAAFDEIDLAGIRAALWRRKWWVLGPTVMVAIATLIAVNLMTPRYKSEARILIEGRENIFLRPEAERLGDRDRIVDPEAVASQVQVVLSRELARQVIRRLKLGERSEFDPVLSGVSFFRHMLSVIGFAKDPLKMSPEERVFEAYYDRVAAFPVDKSRVIAVEFQSIDPELAAQTVNAIVEVYLGLQQEAKQDQTRVASQWLATETENLRKRVAEAEARVEALRANSNLLVGTNNTTLSNQQLGELNSQLGLARSQRAEAEAKAQLVRSLLRANQSIEASEIINSELIRRLAEQEATLRAQLAEQSSTLLDRHPRIKELKAQIADLNRRIRGEAEKIVRSFENDARIAAARVDSLSANLDQMKNQAASTNEQDVQLRALEREAKSQRDLLESYLAKYREASARDSLNIVPTEARVISRAAVSNTPYFPKKLPTVLIATLATLVLSAGFVTTSALLPGTAYRPLFAEPAYAPAPRPQTVEAVTPRESLADFEASSEGPLSDLDADRLAAVGASFAPPAPSPGQELAGAIIANGEPSKRITVVGVERGIGTTSTAVALARALAEEGKVVLLDLAIGSPNVAAISRDPDAPGIADLIRGTASFRHIITRDRYSRVHLIAAGHLASDGAGILSSERLTIAVNALARTYDHVVIDAGTMTNTPLARFAELAPQAVFVAGDVAGTQIDEAREQLKAAGFANVVTFTDKAPRPDEAPQLPRTAAA